MAENEQNTVNILSAPTVRASLILKHGLAADWASINPILMKGELSIETDTHLLKVGDGTSRYKKLPYLNATSTQLFFDGAYEPETNKVALESTVKDAIEALQGTLSGKPGADKTLTTFKQENGNIVATFEDIEITLANISDAGTAAQKDVISIINELNKASHDIPDINAVVTYVDDKISSIGNTMTFKGIVSTLPIDNTGYNSGDVVCLENTHKEYIFNGEEWEEFGDEGSYALKTISITGSNGLNGGGTLTENRVIEHAIPQGAGIDNNIIATADTFINSIEFDKFGHVINVGTAQVNATNINDLIQESGDILVLNCGNSDI